MATLVAKAHANVAVCPTRRMSEGNLYIFYIYICRKVFLWKMLTAFPAVTNETHCAYFIQKANA